MAYPTFHTFRETRLSLLNIICFNHLTLTEHPDLAVNIASCCLTPTVKLPLDTDIDEVSLDGGYLALTLLHKPYEGQRHPTILPPTFVPEPRISASPPSTSHITSTLLILVLAYASDKIPQNILGRVKHLLLLDPKAN